MTVIVPVFEPFSPSDIRDLRLPERTSDAIISVLDKGKGCNGTCPSRSRKRHAYLKRHSSKGLRRPCIVRPRVEGRGRYNEVLAAARPEATLRVVCRAFDLPGRRANGSRALDGLGDARLISMSHNSAMGEAPYWMLVTVTGYRRALIHLLGVSPKRELLCSSFFDRAVSAQRRWALPASVLRR